MYTGLTVGSLEVITLAQNSTKFSSIYKFDKSAGFAGMLLTISAGSVSITQANGLSEIGPFVTAVDSAGTALGKVCSVVGAGTYWIAYDPILSPFMRFKCVEANVASTTVSFTPMWSEDR